MSSEVLISSNNVPLKVEKKEKKKSSRVFLGTSNTDIHKIETGRI